MEHPSLKPKPKTFDEFVYDNARDIAEQALFTLQQRRQNLIREIEDLTAQRDALRNLDANLINRLDAVLQKLEDKSPNYALEREVLLQVQQELMR